MTDEWAGKNPSAYTMLSKDFPTRWWNPDKSSNLRVSLKHNHPRSVVLQHSIYYTFDFIYYTLQCLSAYENGMAYPEDM